jgi:hypothetical protein
MMLIVSLRGEEVCLTCALELGNSVSETDKKNS